MIAWGCLLLGLSASFSVSAAEESPSAVTCSRDFRKVGCFVRDLRLVPDLLITDLDPTHDNFTTNIDWADYGSSLHSLACRCREKAYGKYKYFGIGMYGECVAGNDNPALESLFKNPDKVPYSCINGEDNNCDAKASSECAGTADYDFFYEVIKGDCSAQIAKGELTSLLGAQTKMEKGKKIATIPKLGMLYDISFEVYPTAFQSGWASILHLAGAAGNGQDYGGRIPGIWFQPSSSTAKVNDLHICNAINGNWNYVVNTVKKFPLNKWFKVRLNQVREDSNLNYVYRIYINDEKIHEVINNAPMPFEDVSVYTGDPWFDSQQGYIRNLKIAENCVDITAFKPNEISAPKEAPLAKSTVVGTIPTLCKDFSVSFDVKATSFQSGWSSILHATIGGNSARYGDRVPGVWFWPSSPSAKTNKLHVCGPVNKNRNYCYNSQQFPTNEWINVKVEQARFGEEYYYSVSINSKVVMRVQNTYPSTFYGVKVYAGDPWYEALPGSIKNINYESRCYNKAPISEELSIPGEKVLVKDTLLGTITTWCKEFTVSFEVKPTKYNHGWANVLHLSRGEDAAKYGDRVPGVWFHPSSPTATTNKLHICGPVNNNRNWCYNSSPFPLNEWISIIIKQSKSGDDYYYSISINGKEVHKVKNIHPSMFYGIKVFAADPWYNSQAGSIRNLKVQKQCHDSASESNELKLLSEMKLVKNTLLKKLSVMCKEFSVSFDVKPTAFIAGWGSILHISQGGDCTVYGDRVPGVWFWPSSPSATSNKLHICGPVNGNRNYCYNSGLFPKNQWISIKVQQVKVAEHFYYSVFINGKELMKVKNSSPSVFYGVTAYSADPWYSPQPGDIRNIKIDGGVCDNRN